MPRLSRLADPRVRAVFLGVLADTRNTAQAARVIGVEVSTARKWRRRNAEFAAAWQVALGVPAGAFPHGRTIMTEALRDNFLAALSVTGCDLHAAQASGLPLATLYRARKTRPAFATAWAEARARAMEIVEGRLIRQCIEGFETVESIGGVEKQIRRSDWRAMFRLLERHDARGGGGPGNGGRWIEVTPERVAEAKARLTAQFVARALAPPREPVIDTVYTARARPPGDVAAADGGDAG